MVPRSTALYPEGVVGQALVLELAFQHATFALGLCDNFITFSITEEEQR